MSTAIFFALCFGLGILLLVLAFGPAEIRSPFRQAVQGPDSLLEHFRQLLRKAGFFSATPTFVLIGLGMASAIVGLMLAIAFHNLLFIIIGPVVVASGTYLFLQRRRRKRLKVTSDMLVPFIRRMQSLVMANVPGQAAYKAAVLDAPKELRVLLEASVVEMELGKPFPEALRGTLKVVPSRFWEIFVNQVELNNRVGGDLPKALATTVKGIDSMVILQQEAIARYASFAAQQRVVYVVGIIGTIGIFSRFDGSLILKLFTTPMGLVSLLFGICFLGGGIILGQRTLSEIEHRVGN